MAGAQTELFRCCFPRLMQYVMPHYDGSFRLVVKHGYHLRYLIAYIDKAVDLAVYLCFKIGYFHGVVSDFIGLRAVLSAAAVERDISCCSFRECAEICYLFKIKIYPVVDLFVRFKN